MSDLLELGPNDYIFTDLFGVYFYEQKLKKEELEKSLEKTIEVIPLLSSKIVKTEDGYRFQMVKPSNVCVCEKYVEEDLHKLYLPDENGLLNYEEGNKFYGLAENIDEVANIRQPVLDVPLMKITLLQTSKNKSVLCVSINHCLTDAHSLTLMMNTWSEGDNRLVKEFTLSRAGLKMTDGFDMYKCIRPEMDFCRDFHPMKKIYEEEIGFIVTPKDEGVTKLIHFTSEHLEEMKKVVKDGRNDVIVSSNDCIAAHLWKLHTLCRTKNVRSGNIPIKVIANLRNKFSKVDETYFGNCITVCSLDTDRDWILNASFKDLALRIRQLVNSIDERVCQTTIDLVSYVAHNDIMYVWGKCSRKFAFCMNDWRFVEKHLPHFGGKCERLILNPPKNNICLPTVATTLLDQKDGLNVLVSFENDVYEKIKGLDLGRLESLEKVEELFK